MEFSWVVLVVDCCQGYVRFDQGVVFQGNCFQVGEYVV